MGVLDFFKTVLPSEGWYYLVLINRTTKRVTHKAYNSLEALAHAAVELDRDEDFNLYYACASYANEYIEIDGARKMRNPANYGRAKSLWIDLDCGEDKAAKGDGYLTKLDAVKAILSFCKINEFPEPMIVDSGNGIHCYWPFTKAVKHEVWQPMANALKAALTHHNVLADPTVTADMSRILRSAGATNRKRDPKPVIVKRTAKPNKPEALADQLKGLSAGLDIKLITNSQHTTSTNDDLMFPLAQIPTSATEVAKHCNQIKIVDMTGGNVSRPIWFAAIGLTKFCDEGIEKAKAWTSKRGETGHTDTDYQTRYITWNTPPPSCAKFEADNPKGCVGCIYKGSIKTPLVLGRASHGMPLTIEAEEETGGSERPPLFLPDKNGNGRPLATTGNVKTVMEHEGVVTRYNQMTKELEVFVPNVSSVPDESSNSNQTAAIDLLVKHGVPYARAPEQINAIAASNPYCPVRQMIESNPWDGNPRFHRFMSQIDTPHRDEAALYFRKWLIQAIAAVYLLDGLSAAGMLALTGPQGIGKTQLIRLLASAVKDSFLEGATLDPSNKDSVMTIASHWIIELGELDATFRKSDLAQLKAFITRKLDKFRRPYAKKDSEFPRRSVFAGTVNDAEFLHDNTGNRRFWVVQVNNIQIDRSLDIQQLWSEVKTWYDAGETWHFSQQEQISLNQHNSQFEVLDPVVEKIQMKFNFGDMTKTTWLTATRIAEISGIDRPGRSELTRVSSTVKALNGNQFKRTNGLRLLLVPGVHT